MNREQLVQEVNTSLKQHREDAANHRENPRLISLMDLLIRLTNSPEDNAELDKANEAAKPKCPHEVVNRKTGKCVACGEVPEE